MSLDGSVSMGVGFSPSSHGVLALTPAGGTTDAEVASVGGVSFGFALSLFIFVVFGVGRQMEIVPRKASGGRG
jgi:hypothetical protein